MNSSPRPLCLACSIFQKEIQALQASGQVDLPVAFLDSMLHMVPAKLEERLQTALSSARGEAPEQALVLAYGDCCGHMETFEAQAGTARTQGINCCEIILGRETYRRLRKEGAFFLMPEWAKSWRKIFEGQLGLTGSAAQGFMQDLHSKLIYLDTGLVPVPHADLLEASAFMGLPMEILPVSLEALLASLNQALGSARSHE